MCAKIEELNGLSANEILQRTHQSNLIPVDISQICYELGIRTQSTDFTPIEKSEFYQNQVTAKGSILGVVIVKNKDIAILYRDKDTLNRKRFTIAHELAHCCLHMKPTDDKHIQFRTDTNSNNAKEIAANKFAGELLIPTNSIKMLMQDRNSATPELISFLSDIFAVSDNVMKERLKGLKYKIIS